MRRGHGILAALAVFALLIFLNNTSLLARHTESRPVLIAHRGVAQTFSHTNLGLNDCTATRIDKPTHPFLENTIPSMAESFRLGADVAELDVHATTDGQFAVFHDWTVDCRTNGHGETDMHSMGYLKTLDIGYGYTADGGRTFPFRGKGAGMMPTLDEVLARFPDKRFLINIKSNDVTEGILLARRLAKLAPQERARLMVYGGGDKPLDELRKRLPDLVITGPSGLKRCAWQYIAFGWTGYVPEACRKTMIIAPVNYTWIVWGWPDRFVARMQSVGSPVFVVGPLTHGSDFAGIDSAADFRELPPHYSGGIWTNKIEVIAPLAKGP